MGLHNNNTDMMMMTTTSDCWCYRALETISDARTMDKESRHRANVAVNIAVDHSRQPLSSSALCMYPREWVGCIMTFGGNNRGPRNMAAPGHHRTLRWPGSERDERSYYAKIGYSDDTPVNFDCGRTSPNHPVKRISPPVVNPPTNVRATITAVRGPNSPRLRLDSCPVDSLSRRRSKGQRGRRGTCTLTHVVDPPAYRS